MHSGSIIASRSAFTHTGSPRPARLANSIRRLPRDWPATSIPNACAKSPTPPAWALLSKVHKTDDPAIVERVLTLVDREGVDVIAELWSKADPDSLPGVLWRLYLLRSWMRKQRDTIARLWQPGRANRHLRLRDRRRGFRPHRR